MIKKFGQILTIIFLILSVNSCKTFEPNKPNIVIPKDPCGNRPEFTGCIKISDELDYYDQLTALQACMRELKGYIFQLRVYANCREKREKILIDLLN